MTGAPPSAVGVHRRARNEAGTYRQALLRKKKQPKLERKTTRKLTSRTSTLYQETLRTPPSRSNSGIKSKCEHETGFVIPVFLHTQTWCTLDCISVISSLAMATAEGELRRPMHPPNGRALPRVILGRIYDEGAHGSNLALHLWHGHHVGIGGTKVRGWLRL